MNMNAKDHLSQFKDISKRKRKRQHIWGISFTLICVATVQKSTMLHPCPTSQRRLVSFKFRQENGAQRLTFWVRRPPGGWASSTRRGAGRKVRSFPLKRREHKLYPGMCSESCREVPDHGGGSKSLCQESLCSFFGLPPNPQSFTKWIFWTGACRLRGYSIEPSIVGDRKKSSIGKESSEAFPRIS